METEPCLLFTEAVNYYHNPAKFPPVQPLPFNVNPGHRSWEMLEAARLRRLGIPSRFSRNCNIVYNSQVPAENFFHQIATNHRRMSSFVPCIDDALKKTKRFGFNSLSPFFTYEKKTCGYFFSRDTDNRKSNFGIPASDTVAWRSDGYEQIC